MDGWKNIFIVWFDEEFDYEIDDRDVNKIFIVIQILYYMCWYLGGDCIGNYILCVKMSVELVKVINDGFFYYEQDLWVEKFEFEYFQIK